MSLIALLLVHHVQSLAFKDVNIRKNAADVKTTAPSSLNFASIAKGGQAELLLPMPTLNSYFEVSDTNSSNNNNEILHLADRCRQNYLRTGIAHIPNFVNENVVQQMVEEATQLSQTGECFYSTDSHTIYQEDHDPTFPDKHPRNALQMSSKTIVDYARIPKPVSPLYLLYTSRELKAFVSYVVRPEGEDYSSSVLFESGCDYNAAYYNIYGPGDGLGWHFDRSDFGINLELQRPNNSNNNNGGGGDFELCWNTRGDNEDPWCFDKVRTILKSSTDKHCPLAQRIQDPSPVGPGSLVFFAGSLNLHRVTPVSRDSDIPRVNAIMTYEKQPGQKPNAYSLQKFFGR